MTSTTDGRRSFRWTVEIEVSETWVEDGFDLTEDRLLDMLGNDLPHAQGCELAAKILKKPTTNSIRKAQGYQI